MKLTGLAGHEMFMEEAIRLAGLGRGKVSPNPMVGAVIVNNGQIVGSGYHAQYGGPHAEVHAIRMAGEKAKGATLYVTLEPCAHEGKTPPCVNLIIESGIKKVFVGMVDPNPIVNGAGLRALVKAGIQVVTGVLEEECIRLNESFIKYIKEGIPFVTTKSAMSLDGKIATITGESKWITSERARRFGRELRGYQDAILVGITTVLADDPLLTASADVEKEMLGIDTVRHPAVVVLDAFGRTPSKAKIWEKYDRKVFIFVSNHCKEEDKARLMNLGAEVIIIPFLTGSESYLDPQAVLVELGKRQIASLLVEGGGTVISSFLYAKCVDKCAVILGDYILGGKEATPAVGGVGYKTLAEATRLRYDKTAIFDNNVFIEAYVQKGEE